MQVVTAGTPGAPDGRRAGKLRQQDREESIGSVATLGTAGHAPQHSPAVAPRTRQGLGSPLKAYRHVPQHRHSPLPSDVRGGLPPDEARRATSFPA